MHPRRWSSALAAPYPAPVIVWANMAQGAVALVWVAIARRLIARGSADLGMALWAVGLVVPLGVTIGQAAFASHWTAIRVERWMALLRGADLPLDVVAYAVISAAALMFVLQELLPALDDRRAWRRAPESPDARLETSVARMTAQFRNAGVRLGPAPATARVETDAIVAALGGLRRPRILVSRRLLRALDDAQLDALVAHELAHLARGGNRGMLLLWLARAAQVASPAALVIFRALAEAQEIACDALAAQVTGRPAELASVLLEVSKRAHPPPKDGTRGAGDLRRRGQIALTQHRVRALLDGPPSAPTPRGAVTASVIILGALLWGIA